MIDDEEFGPRPGVILERQRMWAPRRRRSEWGPWTYVGDYPERRLAEAEASAVVVGEVEETPLRRRRFGWGSDDALFGFGGGGAALMAIGLVLMLVAYFGFGFYGGPAPFGDYGGVYDAGGYTPELPPAGLPGYGGGFDEGLPQRSMLFMGGGVLLLAGLLVTLVRQLRPVAAVED